MKWSSRDIFQLIRREIHPQRGSYVLTYSMANYKELNKELVEQVQAMRVSIQEYRDEITSLRAKSMRNYESNVFLRKKCEDLALLHYQQYMEVINPESSVLAFLQERVQLQKVLITPVQRQETDTENSSVRQSARLTAEYRRSTTFSQTRRSFNTTSPIRTPSSTEVEVDDGDVLETEGEALLSILSNAILEENEQLQQSMPPVVQPHTTDLTTYSVDNDNTVGQSETSQEASVSTSESTLRSPIDANADENIRVLRNITNRRSLKNTLRNNKPARKAKKACVASNSADSEIEDLPIVHSPDSDSLPGRRKKHVTISRGKCRADIKCIVESSAKGMGKENQSEHQKGKSDLGIAGFEDSDHNIMQEMNFEESIQEARRMTRNIPQIVEPFQLSNENVSAPSYSYALSELSLSQFKNATSSTPRQLQKQSPPVSSPRYSSRPKRSCKPKSLAEPSARSKLRNGSGEKSLIRKKEYKKSTSNK